LSEPGKRSAWRRPRVDRTAPDDSWMDGGRCIEQVRLDPGVAECFFPERGDNEKSAKAKAICNGWAEGGPGPCPVRTECLEYSLQIGKLGTFGIWGGVGERERRRIRVARAKETLGGKIQLQARRAPVDRVGAADTDDGEGARRGRSSPEGTETQRLRVQALPGDGLEDTSGDRGRGGEVRHLGGQLAPFTDP